jgi:hypothetical protein
MALLAAVATWRVSTLKSLLERPPLVLIVNESVSLIGD